MPQLFTIGYEGADPDRFVTALKGAGVAAIADVRAVALSRKRGFSKNALRKSAIATSSNLARRRPGARRRGQATKRR